MGDMRTPETKIPIYGLDYGQLNKEKVLLLEERHKYRSDTFSDIVIG